MKAAPSETIADADTDTAADSAEWGVTEKTGRFSLETKLGMGLVVLLAGVLGFMIYRKLPGLTGSPPAIAEDLGDSAETTPATATGDRLTAQNETTATPQSSRNSPSGANNNQPAQITTAAMPDEWTAAASTDNTPAAAEATSASTAQNPFGDEDAFFAAGTQSEPDPTGDGVTAISSAQGETALDFSDSQSADTATATAAENPFFSDTATSSTPVQSEAAPTSTTTTADSADSFFFDSAATQSDRSNAALGEVTTAQPAATSAHSAATALASQREAFNDPFPTKPPAQTSASTSPFPNNTTPQQSPASTPTKTATTADPFTAEVSTPAASAPAAQDPVEADAFQFVAESPAAAAKVSSTAPKRTPSPAADRQFEAESVTSSNDFFESTAADPDVQTVDSQDPFSALDSSKTATPQPTPSDWPQKGNARADSVIAITPAPAGRKSAPAEPGAFTSVDDNARFVFDEPTAVGGKEYVIAANDSYWSIAQKQYGSARYVQALIEHNRGRAADPLKLQPGMKLAIPPKHVLETKYPQLFGPPKQTSLTASSQSSVTQASHAAAGSTSVVKQAAADDLPSGFYVAPEGVPMYRVDAEDTLTSIAQKHLGRASRWIQLYEMNRANLQDPHKLKIGTVLRLPADAAREPIAPPDPGVR